MPLYRKSLHHRAGARGFYSGASPARPAAARRAHLTTSPRSPATRSLGVSAPSGRPSLSPRSGPTCSVLGHAARASAGLLGAPRRAAPSPRPGPPWGPSPRLPRWPARLPSSSGRSHVWPARPKVRGTAVIPHPAPRQDLSDSRGGTGAPRYGLRPTGAPGKWAGAATRCGAGRWSRALGRRDRDRVDTGGGR